MKTTQKRIYEEIDNFERLNSLVESIVSEQEVELGNSASEWLENYLQPLTAGFNINDKNKKNLETIRDKFKSEWEKTGEFPEQTAIQIVKFVISLSRMQTRSRYGELVGKEENPGQTQKTTGTVDSTPLADPSNPIGRMVKYPDKTREAQEGIYAVMDLIKKNQPQLFEKMFNGSRAEALYDQWVKSKTEKTAK